VGIVFAADFKSIIGSSLPDGLLNAHNISE
jgi:hypothetical protein